LDRIAGWAEVLLVPTSLGLLLVACGLGGLRIWRWRLGGLLLVVWFVAAGFDAGSEVVLGSLPFLGVVTLVRRLAARRPGVRRLAVPLVVLTALTVAQPFGVRAHPLADPEAEVAASSVAERGGLDPQDAYSMDVLSVPIAGFASYRRKIESDVFAGLGECCPPTHTLRVRSWVVPGLLTHATQLSEICGDSPCWDPGESSLRLQALRGERLLVLVDGSKVPEAWRLGFGVVSAWGVIYWLLAAAGIVIMVRGRGPGPQPSAG